MPTPINKNVEENASWEKVCIIPRPYPNRKKSEQGCAMRHPKLDDEKVGCKGFKKQMKY